MTANFPTLSTLPDGVLTSSQVNSGLIVAVQFLLSPPRARLRELGSTSLPNATWTAIAFDGNEYDTVPGHDNATNNTRYTFAYAGIWHVAGALCFGANTTGDRGVRWAVNGSALAGSEIVVRATSGAVEQPVPARTVQIQVAAGDYIEMQGWQTSGGALLTNSGGGSVVNSTIDVRIVSS